MKIFLKVTPWTFREHGSFLLGSVRGMGGGVYALNIHAGSIYCDARFWTKKGFVEILSQTFDHESAHALMHNEFSHAPKNHWWWTTPVKKVRVIEEQFAEAFRKAGAWARR